MKAYKAEHGAERGFRGRDEGEGAVRLRVPDEGATVVHDAIRGDTRFEHVHLDDPVIARADGRVLYNFAVAIDDLDAGITHVVRGEDHLSNTPKQVLVLEAAKQVGLGADAPLPRYAHLPLLHGPDGKKLSKRHGAASVQELRDAGYLPEAVRNYLALLGWGAGDDETVLSTEELVERFTLERVSRNPARFDEVEAEVAERHLHSPAAARGARRAAWRRSPAAKAWKAAVRISQEKIHTLADFWPLSGSLFDGPIEDPKARERWLGAEGLEALANARAALAGCRSFDENAVEEALSGVVERRRAQATRGLPAAAGRDHGRHGVAGDFRERGAARPRGDTAAHRQRPCTAG